MAVSSTSTYPSHFSTDITQVHSMLDACCFVSMPFSTDG